MANEPLESDQPGGEALPEPTFSGSGGSSTSTGADEIVSKLLAQLEPLIERKVQSTKDKRISEIEKVLGGRNKILAELESEGMTIPKEVRTQMQIRELEERLAGQSTPPAQVSDDGSSTQKAAVTEAIAELKKYGLTTDDPAFIEVLRGQYPNRDAFDAKVQRHIVGRLAPQKQPNPADIVQPPVTTQSSGGDTQSKIVRLAELQKQPTRYKAEIAQLVSELDKAGWK